MFNRKIDDLTKKYGRPLLSGSKLLIKLTSAAILIQYRFRKYLTSKQFYPAGQVDTEEERPVRAAAAMPGVPRLQIHKIPSGDRPEQYINSATSNKVRTDRLGESETSRSIRNVLDRNSYREYIQSKGKIVPTDLTEREFPKLLEYREAAIEYRKNNEQRSLDKLRK